MITDKMDIFTCAPHNDLLSNREANEAYCLANPGAEYALYFPNGGEVILDISAINKQLTVQWLDIMKSRWLKPLRVEDKGKITLLCPSKGYWAVLIQ